MTLHEFCENLHCRFFTRALEVAPRYPGVAAWAYRDHGVSDESPLVSSQWQAPADAGPMIASEMAEARKRAAESRRWQPYRRYPLVMASPGLMGLLFAVERVVRALRHFWKTDHWYLADLHFVIAALAVGAAVGFIGWCFATGEQRLLGRLNARWAAALGGTCGTDLLDDVLAWLDGHWRWFIPPHFLANEVSWAIGTRRGAPALVVMERYPTHLVVDMVTSLFPVRGRTATTVGPCWSRVNVFLGGATFRDQAHAEHVRATLALMGGGAVQGPHGIYLYAAFLFLQPHRDVEPALWLDLVDQVLDADRVVPIAGIRDYLAQVGLENANRSHHA